MLFVYFYVCIYLFSYLLILLNAKCTSFSWHLSKEKSINYTDGKKEKKYASYTWYTVQVYIFQQRSYQLFFHFLIPCFSPLLILRHNDKSLDPFTKRSDTRHGNTAETNTLQTTIQIPLISRKLLYLSSGLNKLHYIWHRKWRVFPLQHKIRG